MEDGVKEEPAQCKEPMFLGKAGWVKKAPGKLLASYKDRYIHVQRTEVVVYEHENLQNCLERLDLENYDRCLELRSPFKKKHRLVLIRSAKSGNKVQDVKFQAQTAEEKEAWIKALTDGIHRAKNKVFDEVKVDESSNLEHVTRSRPKGNPNRRPPTRIHMKEVADLSSDGNQRLDLDGAVMPNGPSDNTDSSERTKEAVKVPIPLPSASKSTEKQSGPSPEEGPQTELEVSPQKKVIKPPMPPTKEVKPSLAPEVEPDGPDKKVLKPPMPPSKEVACVSSGEEVLDETNPEKSLEGQKKTAPPPTPPNKPSSSSNQADTSQPRPNSQPPIPPSKPSPPAVEPDQEGQRPANEEKEKEEDSGEETTGTAVEKDEVELSVSGEAVPSVRAKENPGTKDESPEESGNTMSASCSPLPSKKKPEMQHTEDKPAVSQPNERQECTASDTSDSSLQEEDVLPKSDVAPVAVCINVPLTDSISLSPLTCLPGEKKKKTEEKSVDSGQHSDDDSEGSGSVDMLAASTAAVRGSNADLDGFEASEDNVQISVSLKPSQATNKPQVMSKPFPSSHTKPVTPLKPPSKTKSASIGDLLSESSLGVKTGARGQSWGPTDNVKKLETEVALEREMTGALMRRVSQSQSQSQDEGDGKSTPQDLLAEALEKLEKADLVLREVKKLKLAENSRDRKSW